MDDIYQNIKEYNPHKKYEILVALDNMIADMLGNKNLLVIELFTRGTKFNISLIFITHSCFAVSKISGYVLCTVLL